MNPGLVVKLRPVGPWRIGPDSGARNRVDAIYHSDTLYSAVTAAMARLGSLEEWLRATARNGAPAVSFSSCFPFLDEIGFVIPPRTIWPPTAPALMGARVRWKSARFVPLGIVQSLVAKQPLDENQWTVDGPSQCLLPAGRPGPFRTGMRWNAAVDRLTGNVERHSTACIEFRPGAGLWTVVSFADAAARERWLENVKAAFRWLADSGMGGERSRGWGRSEAPEFLEGVLPDMILGAPKPAAAKAQPEASAEAVEAAPADFEPKAGDSAQVSGQPDLAALADVAKLDTATPLETPLAGARGSEEQVPDGGPESAESVAPPPALESEAGASESTLMAVSDTSEPAKSTEAPEPTPDAEPVLESAPVESVEPPPTAEPVLESVPVESVEPPPTAEPAPESAPVESVEPTPAAEPVGQSAQTEAPAPEPAPAAEKAEAGQRESAPAAAAEPAPAAARETIPTPSAGPAHPHWMLSLFTPGATDAVDWTRGDYSLLARAGRVESPAGSGELKKTVQMVAEGSVLYAAEAPRGAAANVAPDGFAHPVFRAGFAVAIPLPEVS